jgi:hypothetical protein
MVETHFETVHGTSICVVTQAAIVRQIGINIANPPIPEFLGVLDLNISRYPNSIHPHTSKKNLLIRYSE